MSLQRMGKIKLGTVTLYKNYFTDFFDEGKLIVLANGFQKKTQKTPKSEIEKALKIKKEYEQEK
jgi:phage-related protein